MPITNSVENNFTGGLKTEFTGLNFPENACTDADNCDFTTIGDVIRRAGIDVETNHVESAFVRAGQACSTYKWENVGGDGNTKLLVVQTGDVLRFWRYSSATTGAPISAQLLTGIGIGSFSTVSTAISETYEFQYADGNGYLFVFHPFIEPFYCSFDVNTNTVTPVRINLQMRDFLGVPENVPVNNRPAALTDSHLYNLYNQGWTSAPTWQAISNTPNLSSVGAHTFTVAGGLPIVPGTVVNAVDISGYPTNVAQMAGTVTSYAGTTLVLNITSASSFGGPIFTHWIIYPVNAGFLNTWNASQGNYPSNADVWWRFKDTTEVFNPTVMAPNVTLNTGNAAKGHFILDVFNQTRSAVSGVSNLTNISTTSRPRTGAWHQGRVWYAGVDSSVVASGTAPFYTWTENIYFSQTITDNTQFGNVYQTNDPTSEEFFDLLPTDGGVITIQGCNSIYKLFPIQNGLLVFAANGIWFITGSQGIGFAANDYTVTKISSVRALSGTSFVNVLGYPIFWNEEGIYAVQVAQQGGGLVVNNMTYSTIGTFYEQIPLSSKMYARGDYDPIGFRISWLFRSTEASNVTTRYEFNRQLNLNTNTQAFFPYTIEATNPVLHDIKFIYGVSGATAPRPAFKYFSSRTVSGTNYFTFCEEYDETNWVDFHTVNPTDYTSYFVTGYKLKGKAIVKWQPTYFNFFLRADRPTAYKIQGIWDYANSGNSGRWSAMQVITNALSRFDMVYKKHKIRGRGLALQLKVTSVDGMPFDIMGWSSMETTNTGM